MMLHPSLLLVVSAVLGAASPVTAAESTVRLTRVPKWSFTAAIALPDGSFEILH
jgi:hypothetical protein